MPGRGDTAGLRAQVRDSYTTREALEVYRARVDNGLRSWESTVVEQHFPPSGSVLTIGCGAGRETFALEQRGYAVVGVDISLPLLQIAREIRSQRQCSASFYLVDGATLPFVEASFDIVTLWAQMLANVPSPAERLAVLREVRRVLRPGGLASLSVHDDERSRPRLDPATVKSADSPERGDFVLDERNEGAVRYCHLFTRAELEGLLRDAGFADAVIQHTSELGETWDNVLVAVGRAPQ